MSPEVTIILLFSLLLIFIALGAPIAFVLGGLGVAFTYFLWGPGALYALASITFGKMSNYFLAAIPLFVFMAMILERSGVADDLYTMMHRWLGPLRGGLAIGTILICTVVAAMSGITGVGAITMGLIALPAMLKRNYDKGIAIGCIPAGGALGSLIPPSLAMILYGIQAEVSIGQLFIGGILPGVLLSSLFIFYIGIRCFLQPKLGPALPPEDRATWSEKLLSLRAIILPLLLVIGVLGSIFAGIATVTEAAAVGAIGSVVSAAIYRKLNWQKIKEASYVTIRLSSMILLIMAGASLFTTVFVGLGGSALIGNMIEGLPLGRWGILILMQISWVILGCVLDPTAIIVITTPIYVPIITSLGFDPLWFGILFILNMEMGFLTPPFGITLFMFKGVVPDSITMGDIYRSIFPFIILQALALVTVMIFPIIALWLPSLMIR